MDVRDLEVFLALVNNLNFTRAGQEIHLSQPSVSVRVRRLQEELEVKLFEQIGKKIVLTEAGRLLETHARRVVTAQSDTRQAMEAYRGLEQGSIGIAASTTPGMYLVPRIIAKFKSRHPKIAIRLRIKNTRQVEEDIIKDEFDLGFVGGHLISEEIETFPWRIDALVLVVSPSHSLARKRQIKPSDLENEIFINREPGSATQAAIEKQLPLRNLSISAAVEMDNPESVKQAIISGIGIAFLPTSAIETELKAKSLVARNVQGIHIDRELKIIYRKGKHLSRAACAFIETAQRLK
jgi:LysR family transcriptional regulator, low CO2-responsive transcriptional regulator